MVIITHLNQYHPSARLKQPSSTEHTIDGMHCGIVMMWLGLSVSQWRPINDSFDHDHHHDDDDDNDDKWLRWAKLNQTEIDEQTRSDGSDKDDSDDGRQLL